MSREFNNGVTTDLMTFPIPASIPVMNDAFVTFAVMRIMATADNTWLSVMEFERSGGGTPCCYMGFAATGGSTRESRYINTNGSSSTGVAATDADGWFIEAVIRSAAAGTTYYKRVIGGSTTTSTGGALADGLAWNSGGVLKVGGDDDPAFIRLACIGYLNGATVTTGTIDGWDSTQDLIDAGFTAVYDDSDGFATDLVGSADRSAINGTTDNADDPAGWTYFSSATDATVTGVPSDATATAPLGVITATSTVTAVIADAAADAPAGGVTATAGTEDFETRANGALDAPWTTFGGLTGLTVSSGAAYAVTDGVTLHANAYTALIAENQFCQQVFEAAPSSTTNFQPAVYARISALSATPAWYEFKLAGANVQIRKASSGTPSTVAQEARSNAINTITGIQIEAISDTIIGYVQVSGSWVEEIRYTDGSPLTGSAYVGIGHTAAVGGSNPQGLEEVSWGAVPGVDATVTAVPAVAAADAPVGVLTGAADVAAVPALALATAPPANQMISSVVNAPAVVALADAPVATVGGGGDATVTAVPAVAGADAPVGVLLADSAVAGVPAVAAGDAPAGVLSAGATVGGVPAVARTEAPRPQITPSPGGGNQVVSIATTFAEDSA